MSQESTEVASKVIEYYPLPPEATITVGGSVTLTGEQYSAIQNRLLQMAFFEKLVESKYTVFEKIAGRDFSGYGREPYYVPTTYRCVGPDELTKNYTAAVSELEKYKAENTTVVSELRSSVHALQVALHNTQTSLQTAQASDEKHLDMLRKYKGRGFFRRVFNLPPK